MTMQKRLSLLGFALIPLLSHALSDSQLFDARDAYRKGDTNALYALAAQADKGPLDAYPAYWLSLKALETGDSNPARQFVNRYRSGYLVERTLNELLEDMGRRGQWDDLLDQLSSLKVPNVSAAPSQYSVTVKKADKK